MSEQVWWMRRTRRGTMPVWVWLRLLWENRAGKVAEGDGETWGEF